MGGKTKTSQRTKNNVRPSSSGRSAELLNNATNIDYFGTAGTGKILPAVFPTLASVNTDSALSAEYLVCFKKFNKKDPVTKTKALQELTELVKAGNNEDTVAALPSWAHFYQFLTIDSDRRVREATQACHGAVLAACGRRAAPQLRRLVPLWLLALHDDHAPAACAARAHLQKTFPEDKLPEVLSFCKVEIVTLLVENLSGNAEAMLSKKVEDQEEKDLQISRVLASSLWALELFLAKLPRSHDDWLWDALGPLLQRNHFWNLARNPSQQIRAAWYAAVGGTVRRYGQRADAALGRRVATALVAEPERAASVAAQRWAALLLLMQHAEEWPAWLDKKELLVTRLLDAIENGGWGAARVLASMLGALLARLPQQLLSKSFYTNFFDAFCTGLENKALLNSKSERHTWISSMSECLHHLSGQEHEYAAEVVTYVHRSWLRTISSPRDSPTRNDLIKHSATDMAALLKRWLLRSRLESGEKYDQLARNFWQNIGSSVAAQIERLAADPEDIARSIESHTLLLKSLRTAFLHEGGKKKLRVVFEDQKRDECATGGAEVPADSPSACDAALAERFHHDLEDLVQRTSCAYFDFAYKKQMSQAVCPLLSSLLMEFESEKLFGALARHFGADSVAYGFYDRVLRPWLAGDTMRCEALVDIVFLLVNYLTADEQECMFDSFQQFPPRVVEWCLRASVRGRRGAAARRWLRGHVAEAGAVALAARGDGRAAELLLACLEPEPSGEVPVSAAAVERAVAATCEGLRGARGPEGPARAALATRLAALLARGQARAQAEPLLRVLLQLRPTCPWAHDAFRDAWRDAAEALPAPLRDALLRDALRDTLLRVLKHDEKLDVERVEAGAAFCAELLGTSDRALDIPEAVTLTKRLFSDLETGRPRSPLEWYALRCDCIHGNISLAFARNDVFYKKMASGEDHQELRKEDLVPSACRSLFRTFYLRAIAKSQCARSNGSLADFYFKEELSRVLYDYVVIHTLYQYYTFWPHYEIVKQTKLRMDCLLEEILSDISAETRDALFSFFDESNDQRGFYWMFARKVLDIKLNEIAEKQNRTPESPNKSIENSASELRLASFCDEDDIEQIPSEDKSNYALAAGDRRPNIMAEEKVEAAPQNNKLSLPNGSEVTTSKSKTEDATANIPEVTADRDLSKPTSLQRHSESTKEPQLSELTSEQATPETPLEHNLFGESSLSDRVRWADILGFPSLQEVVRNSAFYLGLQADEKYCPERVRDHKTRYMVMLRSLFSTYMHEPQVAVQLLADVAQAQEPCDLDPVINGYYRHNDLMLFEKVVSHEPWAQVTSCAAVVACLSASLAATGPAMPTRHWDFATITLSSLLDSLHLSRHRWDSPNVATLLCGAVGLLGRVMEALAELRASGAAPVRLAEWDDVFAPHVHRHLFGLLLAVLRSAERPLSASGAAVLDGLVRATRHLQWRGAGEAGAEALHALTEAAVRVLRDARAHPYQYLAFHTLQLVAQPLVYEDAMKLKQWSAREDEAPRPAMCFAPFGDALAHLEAYAEAALSNVKLGEGTCEMVPFSDSHRVALGYLLLGAALLALGELARGDLRLHYAREIRELRFAEGLLSAALRLLPGPVASFAFSQGAAPPARLLQCFQTLPPLDVYESCDGTVGALACAVLTETLGGAGMAGARSWVGAAPARVAAALRRLAPAALAPPLLRRQLRQLRARAAELPDAHVTIQWSRGEVQCALTVDERELELTVRFAPEHPLVPPMLSAPPYSPVPDTSWLVLYLAYQNGTLLNALKMWIRAVTARVESAPQCYVCYCRMHHATGRLPNVPCHQCRNKFHSDCLRKWFLNSHKSTCPLCRGHL